MMSGTDKYNTLVVVTGATASGKTALAIELAEHFNTEIISADSRQLYRDIPIGTAAPTECERSRVFHHLVGCLGLEDYYSAAPFETDALAILKEIYKKSRVAVVCGGSMMYIDALCRGIDEMPTVSEPVRAYVLRLLNENGPVSVLAQLQILDPVYYEEVDKANMRRVVHAVEICLEAGMPYSQLRTGNIKERDFNIIKFAIEWPREELFARINSRVDMMMNLGLEDEARRALAKGSFNSLNTVGYKEMAAYFRDDMTRDEAIARIAKNTRVYAKKQLTWLKRDSDVIWLSPVDAFDRACSVIERKTVSASSHN